LCIALIISANSGIAEAQILQDSTTIGIITRGMQNIYNIEFKEAGIAYEDLSRLYPGHPVLHLFNGMKIYWENFPILPSSSARVRFEKELRKCIELSDKGTSPSESYEAEYLLSNLCARGLLLLFFADNDLSGEVGPLAINTYRPLMRSFNFTSACSDFYYFTGVYNYYRDAYPQVYPIYKTVAFMFPQGNLELGLQQLKICGENSIALRAEAFSILYWIRMNFEANFREALPYSRLLVGQYPSNPLFKVYYIKNLLLLKQYEEAEKVIMTGGKADGNPFYIAALNIFNGILQEKKYRSYDSAKKLYLKGIDELSVFGSFANEYIGYGYFGLSRISEREGNSQERRSNRRKAMDLVDFKNITFDY
jgi:hypothetical protein